MNGPSPAHERGGRFCWVGLCGWVAPGNVWEKQTIIVHVRPQRHTKKYMAASGRFTATFFDGHQKELLYLGTHSGNEEPDKIAHSGLRLTHVDGQPTFADGRVVLICKALYTQQLAPERFVDPAIAAANFPDKDYSHMYVAEIEAACEMQAE